MSLAEKGTAIGGTIGLIGGAPGAALGAALGGLIGGVIDIASDISDAVTSVEQFLGLDRGPGANRTELRAALGPKLAAILRAAPPSLYWWSYTQIGGWIQANFTANPSDGMRVVFRFDDDPSFVQDVMNDLVAAAPPPPGTSLPGFLTALAMPFGRNAALYGFPGDVAAQPKPAPNVSHLAAERGIFTPPKVSHLAAERGLFAKPAAAATLHASAAAAVARPALHPQLSPPDGEYTAPHEGSGVGLGVAAVALLALLAIANR